MNDQKLTYARWGTYIATFALLVAMVLVWKFKFYDVVSNQIVETNKAVAAAQTTAGKLKTAQIEALLAQQKLELAQGELDYLQLRYRSLPFDLTGTPNDAPTQATFVRYLNEYSTDFGLEARAQLIRAADESGVIIATDIKVDAPPQVPEDVKLPTGLFLKPQLAPLEVTITGPFNSLLRFFQIINRSEILMVVGNVKLEGVSPAVEATFTITPYLLASGPSPKPAAIAGTGGAAAGGTTAGGATAGGTTAGGPGGGMTAGTTTAGGPAAPTTPAT